MATQRVVSLEAKASVLYWHELLARARHVPISAVGIPRGGVAIFKDFLILAVGIPRGGVVIFAVATQVPLRTAKSSLQDAQSGLQDGMLCVQGAVLCAWGAILCAPGALIH